MRRMLSILLTAALAAGLCCVTAFAHHGGVQNCWEYSVSVCTGCGGGHSYVDANGDGICDHHDGSLCDQDGDGLCDLCGAVHRAWDGSWSGGRHHSVCWSDLDTSNGATCGHCDEDGDGLCDLCGNACAAYTGARTGGHHGGGHHHGWR